MGDKPTIEWPVYLILAPLGFLVIAALITDIINTTRTGDPKWHKELEEKESLRDWVKVSQTILLISSALFMLIVIIYIIRLARSDPLHEQFKSSECSEIKAQLIECGELGAIIAADNEKMSQQLGRIGRAQKRLSKKPAV